MTRNQTYTTLRPRFASLGGVLCPDSQSRRSYAENSVNADICAIFRGGVFCWLSSSYEKHREALASLQAVSYDTARIGMCIREKIAIEEIEEIREIKEIKEIKEVALNSLNSLNSLNYLNSLNARVTI